MDQQRFFDAVKENKIELVKEMLTKGVDMNALNPDGEGWCTSLYRSVRSNNFEITKLLVDNGADCNIGQLDFHNNEYCISTPIDFLCNHEEVNGEKVNDEILKYLLENRPVISENMINKRIRYCTQLFDEENHEMLFDYAASYFLRENMYHYLAHLGDNIQLKMITTTANLDGYRRRLWNKKGNYEPGSEPLGEDGSHHLYFTHVIRSLFEDLVLFKLRKSCSITSPEQYDGILHELCHNLEAYNLLINICRIPDERIESLYPSIVKNIIKKLKKLNDKEEYTLPMAWGGHAVCLNFVGQPGSSHSIAIRIDNLNDCDRDEHKWYKIDHSLVMIPKVIGEIPLDGLDENKNYLKSLLECMKNYVPRDRGIEVSYNKRTAIQHLNIDRVSEMTHQLEELSKTHNVFIGQASGNCFIKSHEPGAAIRSKKHDIFQTRLIIMQVYAAKLPTEIAESVELQKKLKYYWKKEPTITTRFKVIRQRYEGYCIERIINPAKVVPIGQSYINLAVVETKEQKEKEKKLHDAKHIDAINSTYEEIYGAKNVIEIKDMFKECKGKKQQVLVLGRAGIGKTTFCQYVAHQWGEGEIWPRFELVVLILLRHLTETRYPPRLEGYRPIDLVEKEYYSCITFPAEEKTFIERQCENPENSHILWLLDGYDEFVQNIPKHLQDLFEHLRTTHHHIITSRPYLNTLPHVVKMEITGFTDNNIEKYVEQFFDHIEDESYDASSKAKKLLSFFKLNPSIWGVAHIPINLELICSLWSNVDWSETKELTMTALYDNITEWLCRRYLTKQNIGIQITTVEIYEKCCTELAFLETLAFKGMENYTIILRKELLQEALKVTGSLLKHRPHLLNIGILKSLDHQLTGNHIEVNKDHYFVHLSFQEYFAARYLVNALDSTVSQQAIEFIKTRKYDQRFALVFTFASGLLTDQQPMNLFWETLLGEPLDLVGFSHVQIVIACFEEAGCRRQIPHFQELMNSIIQWIKYHVFIGHNSSDRRFFASLQRSSSLVNQPEILDTFIKSYKVEDTRIRERACSLIHDLPISSPYEEWIRFHLTALSDNDMLIRISACKAFEKMGAKAATNDVIEKLLTLSCDTNDDIANNEYRAFLNRRHRAETDPDTERQIWLNHEVTSSSRKALVTMGESDATNEVINRIANLLDNTNAGLRSSASKILAEIGEKAATNEVINKLATLLGDTNDLVRSTACVAVAKIGEKAATNEVINRLSTLLGDTNDIVRSSACKALAEIGEKAATNEVINKLLTLLGDTNDLVRSSACEVLVEIGEKARTKEVINGLLILLSDMNDGVRNSAKKALAKMSEKAATIEVINRLLILLSDETWYVKECACEILMGIGEQAATDEVISKLSILLGDRYDRVRNSAIKALAKMGEKAATIEVINRFIILLGDINAEVRSSASEILGKIGKKAATNEVINKLATLLGDTNYIVRNSATKALAKMGEKAATNEVINKLLILLSDRISYVRISACETLMEMGEKAATDEVIKKLLILLSDTTWYIRESACKILMEISEKAATDEVINQLLILLSDKTWYIRESACKILGEMGGKAATNEVVSKLSILLGGIDPGMRNSAQKALAKMGEKVPTDEMINQLLILLSDKSWYVKQSACKILMEMGEKAATDEVISKLLIVLGGGDSIVSSSAKEALAKMGEKAATNEVIKKLLTLFDDTNSIVRKSACNALGEIGEKAATDEVIKKVSNLLGDTNDLVRSSACSALAKIGEKAATDEVINKLLNLLSDEIWYVKKSAWKTLIELGEKVATDKVINKLLTILGDTNHEDRSSACTALGKMGKKAATNEVIERLLDAYHHEDSGTEDAIRSAIIKVLDLLPSLSDLKDVFRVQKLSMCVQKMDYPFLKNISLEKFIRTFLMTEIEFWLPIIRKIFILHKYAITVTENTIVVYGSREPIELPCPKRELGQQLKDCFVNWLGKSLPERESVVE